MTAIPDRSNITFEDYLEFSRNHPEARYEFHDGHITMQVGGSLNHSRIAVNISTLLQNRLGESSCQVFNSDAIVRLP